MGGLWGILLLCARGEPHYLSKLFRPRPVVQHKGEGLPESALKEGAWAPHRWSWLVLLRAWGKGNVFLAEQVSPQIAAGALCLSDWACPAPSLAGSWEGLEMGGGCPVVGEITQQGGRTPPSSTTHCQPLLALGSFPCSAETTAATCGCPLASTHGRLRRSPSLPWKPHSPTQAFRR